MNCIFLRSVKPAFHKEFVTFESINYHDLKSGFLLFFLIAFVSGLHAQQPNYLYNEITVKEGLAQVTVNFVQQDYKGFMWFGGNGVVQRYDGHRFLNFYIGKNRKIPGSNLQGMQYDSVNNRLWMLTGNKELGYLDVDKLTYHPVKIVTPPGFENIWFALQVNKQGGVILIYIDKGIATYNEKANEVSFVYNTFQIPAGWEPRHLWQDEYGHYWISSRSGLLKYDIAKKIFCYRGHNENADPVIRQFANRKQPGFIYSYGNMYWLGFDSSHRLLYSYNRVNGEVKEWHHVVSNALQGAYHWVHAVLEFRDGTTWMAGTGLFAQVDYQQHMVTPIKAEAAGANSIRFDDVHNLFQDREKSIWVCTNKGLYRFNPTAHVFNTITNKAVGDSRAYSNSVTGFVETTDGELLVSTWGAGVFSYDSSLTPIASKHHVRTHPDDLSMAWCLLQRKNGDVWQGHQDGRIGVYQAASKTMNWHHPEPVRGRTIRQLAEDQNGNVWIGTHGGQLVKWDAVTQSYKLVRQFKREIARLYLDTKNNLWVCTDNDGVHCVNTVRDEIIHSYTENAGPGKSLLINGALDILQYDDTTMVMAANGLNILNTKSGTFKYLDEGTPVTNLVLDKGRNLWFTYNTGIACRILNNEELIYTFDSRDGVANTDFHSGASHLLRNGKIVLGTSHDFIVFDPARPINFTLSDAKVYISQILLGNQRLSVDSLMRLPEIILPHNENSITIYFTNNQYQTLQHIHYMVEGLDKDWKRLTAGSDLNLSYLQPGKYVVKAVCFNEKFQPGTITSITIIVTAPFYKTWWFYSLLALLVVAILFWLDKERAKRKEAFQQMRSNIANNLHQEVNTALNNINILSEMALRKAANEPDKAMDFMQQIQSKSHYMILAMDDMLWAIDPNNDSMEKTTERLQEYIDALNIRDHANIDMLVDEMVKSLNLNMQLRHDALILFKESINGLLHAGATHFKIHILYEKAELLFVIQFRNDHCDLQLLNNLLHRQDLGKRMYAINAKLSIDIQKSNSIMELKVPV